MRTKRKRMRLPNGFGRITELHGNLRNPYRVMVTVGTDKQGRPIGKLLKPQAYFATYNEAYTALIKYHENPADMAVTMTMEELYERWSAVHYPEVTKNSRIAYISAWQYCEKIKGLVIREVRSRHVKDVCENGVSPKGRQIPASTRSTVKVMLNQMFKYAMENDWADKNYAKVVSLSKAEPKRVIEHHPFTDDELNIMWDRTDVPNVDMLLIQCYMGWRPAELMGIEMSKIDLSNRVVTGGVKTAAGINRAVPIHSLIYPLIEARYNKAMERGSTFLFSSTKTGQQMSYSKYLSVFKEVLCSCGLNESHRPHDPRKTFVTIAKKYNVDEYALKLIVGHYIADITERIYCERDITWLRTEIEKIRKPSC